MNITEKPVSDQDVLLERLTTGKPLDPDVYRRIRARAESITEELRNQHGELNIAVDLIREVRNDA